MENSDYSRLTETRFLQGVTSAPIEVHRVFDAPRVADGIARAIAGPDSLIDAAQALRAHRDLGLPDVWAWVIVLPAGKRPGDYVDELGGLVDDLLVAWEDGWEEEMLRNHAIGQSRVPPRS